MKSLGENYCKFKKVYFVYMKQGVRFRKQSKLKDSIQSSLLEGENELLTNLKDVSSIKVTASVGLHQLAANAKRENEILPICFATTTKLNKLVADKDLLYTLNRRIIQQKQASNPELDPESLNDFNLSWCDSFENMIERRNSGQTIQGPLRESDLIACETFLEDSSAVPVFLLLELFKLEQWVQKRLVSVKEGIPFDIFTPRNHL